MGLAVVFSIGIKGWRRAARPMGSRATGPRGPQRALDRLMIDFCPTKYDPPSFALKLGHERMRLANMVFRRDDGGAQPSWENRQPITRVTGPVRTLRHQVEVDPQRIQEVLERDPPHNAGAKGCRNTLSAS
jgi:hypothetical protein